jgi:Flp pilus assembly protein TadG
MKKLMRRAGGLRSERGAALVEFALVVPFLMIIMCATIDFGLAVFQLNNLTAAVREGGRFAAAKQPLAANDPAVNQRVYNYITPGMNNGMTNAQKLATISNSFDNATGLVTVRITGYAYKPMTPLASLLRITNFTMNRTAIFKYEYWG